MRTAAFTALASLAIGSVCLAAPTAAQQSDAPDVTIRTESRMLPTGGALDFRDPAEVRAARVRRPRPTTVKASADTDADWLYDFVARLIDGEPAAAKPRRVARARPGATQPATVASIAPTPPPAAKGPGAAAITTGTFAFPPAPGSLDGVHKDDLDAMIVGEAEKNQARNDLVKLELANRAYDERRLSGQSAFDRRIDWRVLERAKDALSSAEVSASAAAGFEAAAYINDTNKTIVVAIAGTQDLRRDFIEADIWKALIQAQSPQQFFLAKSYIRSVQKRYQAAGYVTECVGHSLGGGACAYAASELGIRAVVVNPISAGKLGELARHYVTNYVVDGDIANRVYSLRGNELTGDVQRIKLDRDAMRRELNDKYGPLAGPIRVIRDMQNAVTVHKIDRALDLIAAYTGTERAK